MDLTSARQLATAVVSEVGDPRPVQVAVCPPFINLDSTFSVLHGSPIRLGAQNMHDEVWGAFTGEISAPMLRAVGCHYVIVGHSERRRLFGESNEGVNRKIIQAQKHKLVPIVCVGETLEERDAGREVAVVSEQVRASLAGIHNADGSELVVAYEPVWAIGTGRTASPAQAQAMHAIIRRLLVEQFGSDTGADTHILYGGSVKPGSAAELFSKPDVDGGLIGGASLKADEFALIVEAAGEVA